MRATIALVVFMFAASGAVMAKDLFPIDILINFPACAMRSSLGNWCKECSIKKTNYRFKYFLEEKEPVTAILKKNRLEIHTTDWFYQFDLKKIKDDEFLLTFTDDAKFGTYLILKDYRIIFDSEKNNWMIVGKKLTYARGELLDKDFKSPDTVCSDKPIYFLK